MPILQAFPLGLVLRATANVVLANGSVVPQLIAIGIVEVAGETKEGLIALENSGKEVLLGTEFLKAFEKKLVLSATHDTVTFVDDPPTPVAAQPVLPPAAAPVVP
jgi:predicted aspartyl protease